MQLLVQVVDFSIIRVHVYFSQGYFPLTIFFSLFHGVVGEEREASEHFCKTIKFPFLFSLITRILTSSFGYLLLSPVFSEMFQFPLIYF